MNDHAGICKNLIVSPNKSMGAINRFVCIRAYANLK